ncbi:MAG: TonB-dependent receptor, partial [Bacteroides sp.]|nr:TonB-dependent receptor [Bacteroides sp.]
DWAVEDGSFLRLGTLSLGYTLPKNFTRKFGVKNLRVYATGNNLFCWTSYSGQDPEVSTNGNQMAMGWDFSAYPKSRSYLFGLNVTF